MIADGKTLYTLCPLEDFKGVTCTDDRDDKLARFCLVTSTLTIEQYCKRRFMRKKHFERLKYSGDLVLPLREYPVSKVLVVYALSSMSRDGEIVEPEFWSVIPDCSIDEDFPFCLSLSPALQRYRGINAFKAVYWAGYANDKVPADLIKACLELAMWNFMRYRGRRVGMTGNIRGTGKEGEHFEQSMPENVKLLLEPYRRKTI